jgi:hypothetical protein
MKVVQNLLTRIFDYNLQVSIGNNKAFLPLFLILKFKEFFMKTVAAKKPKLGIAKRVKQETKTAMAGCGKNWDNLCGARN